MKRLRNVLGLLFLVAACELPNQGFGTLDLTTTAGPGRVTLSWNPVAADSYQVESSTTADFSSDVITFTGAVSPVAIDILPGQTYHFRARAVRAGGTTAWSNAQYTAEGWSWEPAEPTEFTTTGTEVTPYDLGNGDWVIFVDSFTYKLVYSEQLRYDADGLTWTVQLKKTKFSGGEPVSVEDSTLLSRGTWNTPWETFTITEKSVDGVWVALETPISRTLSTEDRTTFTLDGDEKIWSAIP